MKFRNFTKHIAKEDIVHILQTHACINAFMFKNWHDYNVPNSLTEVINHIEKMVKT